MIGLYNVADADPTRRFNVALEESAGIAFGAFGTGFGELAGGLVVAALGFTGVGAFLLIFFAAGATSYFLSEWAKESVHAHLEPSRE